MEKTRYSDDELQEFKDIILKPTPLKRKTLPSSQVVLKSSSITWKQPWCAWKTAPTAFAK